MNARKKQFYRSRSSSQNWRVREKQIVCQGCAAIISKFNRAMNKVLFAALIAGFMLSARSVALAQNTNHYLPFEGLCYGPFRTGENPNVPIYPTISEINSDLTNIIKYLAPEIRTYGMSGTLSNIPALCYSNNINCYPCAYVALGYTSINGVTTYETLGNTTNELNALITVANANYPTTKGLIVGSEAILNVYDPNVVDTLIGCINYVRTNLNPNVKTPITTAETWDNIAEWPNLVSNLDFIMIHVDPIWYGQSITNAVNFVLTQYQFITNSYPGKRVVVGETGWPSYGSYSYPSEPGVASMSNQTVFLLDLNRMLKTNNIECLLFEPFDELWKDGVNTNDTEDNWGLYYANRTMKPSLSNYLSANLTLTLNEMPKARKVNLLIGTYEGNSYSLYGASNLLGGWTATPLTNFTGASGTNQTTITITNHGSNNEFFKVGRDF